MPSILIADSGATKTEWCLVEGRKKKTIVTQGISPYFLTIVQIAALLQTELLPRLKNRVVDEVHYYGTGCANAENARSIKKAIQMLFPESRVTVETDLMGAAKALCGHQKGIACILGTGSNSCYFNGKKIIRNSPGIGYVLGDEGSGAHLGKMVVQHYLYETFDEELRASFDAKYITTPAEILENVYRKPLANRYLAGFALFLAENRGHYIIENIIYDGLHNFFWNHLNKYGEVWKGVPVHFAGSIAFGFADVLKEFCAESGFTIGTILKAPMPGLIKFHASL